jgi:hypothetical protein
MAAAERILGGSSARPPGWQLCGSRLHILESMSRPSACLALALLGWLFWCPLASAGLLVACHDGEAAMDCCLPHEGSGTQPLAKVITATAPPPALIAVAEPLVSSPSPVAPPVAPARSTSSPCVQSLLSVFLI